MKIFAEDPKYKITIANLLDGTERVMFFEKFANLSNDFVRIGWHVFYGGDTAPKVYVPGPIVAWNGYSNDIPTGKVLLTDSSLWKEIPPWTGLEGGDYPGDPFTAEDLAGYVAEGRAEFVPET